MNAEKFGEIKIEKQMMFRFLDGLKKHWDKNPNNKQFSNGIILMKGGLHLQEDSVIESIMTEMFRAIMALEQMGAFQEMRKDESYNSRIEFFADTLLKKIDDGTFFNGVDKYVS